MKSPLIITLLLFCFFGKAQYPGNANDWIDYTKTHYRFSISEDGIYRLNQNDLIAAGIPSSQLVGAHFKMHRNGVEVPLYVTTTGSFSGGDYVEFYGKKNDGEADSPMYSSVDEQPSVTESLFTDEAIHFLTLDSSGGHSRVTAIENNLTGLPEKEEYFMDQAYERTGSFYGGFHRFLLGVNFYESTIDVCEGKNATVKATKPIDFDFGIEQLYLNSDEEATVEFKVASEKGVNEVESFSLSLGSSSARDVSVPGKFLYSNISETFDVSDLQASSKLSIVNNTSKKLVFAERKLTYPRNFNFASNSFYKVDLSKTGSAYMEFENIVGDEVVVYDLSTGERITESVSTTTPIRTSSSSENELVFDSSIVSPTFVNKVVFDDYTQSQHDVLVITHAAMEQPISGENYIEKYINHKESEIGGSWDVLKVDISQLTDQYGYGITGHFGVVKNYIAELKEQGKLPEYLLIIGKGYGFDESFDEGFENDYIPPYGYPGSDTQLVSDYGSSNINCVVGRIGARNTAELKAYIDKVIHYQTQMSQTGDAYQTKEKLWMKDAVHIGGGKTSGEANSFRSVLNGFKNIFEETQFGGNVSSYFKKESRFDGVQDEDKELLADKINSGASVINYFGHSSPNSMEYSISDFSQFNQEGKYPFMITNGCHSGNLYTEARTLSEDFLLVDQVGTLTFLGSSQYGLAGLLNSFCNRLYNSFSRDNYGISLGLASKESLNHTTETSFYNRLLKHQFVFHGDPTLSIYTHEKPDYLITSEDIIFNPEDITAASTEFEVAVTISNIGKAVDESIEIAITRELPNGEKETQTKEISDVYYQKTLSFKFETIPFYSAGQNTFKVEIDPKNDLDEITRANNNVGTGVNESIITEVVKPIFPAEFGITNDPNVELISYAPVFSMDNQQFEIQIDSTALFTSDLLETSVIQSKGGSIKWVPEMSYENETVYYWRIRKQGEVDWSMTSFVFLDEVAEGWNQSHYFQFMADGTKNIGLEPTRRFEFGINVRDINVRTADYPTIPNNQTSYSVDGVVYATNRCLRDIGIVVIDQHTGIPIENEELGSFQGLYGSMYCPPTPTLFYFDVVDEEDRTNIISMLDDVEEGNYVLIYSLDALKPTANGWSTDAVSLIDKLEENGSQLASSILEDAPYVFYFQKGNEDFEGMAEFVGEDSSSIIDENLIAPVNFGRATVTTPLIGPAAEWNTFSWEWERYDDTDAGDVISYSIIGVASNMTESVIASDVTSASYDLSGTSASSYPYMKIEVSIEDVTNFTPAQLSQLRLTYETLPDLAIDASNIQENLALSQTDSGSYIFDIENVSEKDGSEVLVSYEYIEDLQNQELEQERYGAIPAGESLSVTHTENTVYSAGSNYILIKVNPNEDQPESYQFNNTALIQLANAALPVKFAYFTAETPDGKTSLLEWGTASESNNSHFEIEHSVDGINFYAVGEVQGAGDSSASIDYSFVHDSPQSGVNYYRIKQVDYDGQSESTEIETVTIESYAAIYPNPASSFFRVQTPEPVENGSLVIFDGAGHVILQEQPYNSGQEISVDNLKNGSYVVIVYSNDGKKYSHKLIVIRQ